MKSNTSVLASSRVRYSLRAVLGFESREETLHRGVVPNIDDDDA